MVCPKCNGSGVRETTSLPPFFCSLCNGTGYVHGNSNRYKLEINMKDLKEVIEEIKDSTPLMRIQGLLKVRKETLSEFLIRFFTEWNIKKNTLFAQEVEDFIQDPTEDEEEDERVDPIDAKIGEVACRPNKRRSLGDIYMICKYYYPRCTLKQVLTIIYNELSEEIDGFRSSNCSTINKRVFYVNESEGTQIMEQSQKDEYGMTVKNYKSLIE